MTWLDEDEYEKYKKLYEEVKEKTISDYKNSEDGEELWSIAQTNVGTIVPEDEDRFLALAKLAEVALHENKNKNNWAEAINRIDNHVFNPTYERSSMTNYSPLRYCINGSGELINHAIKIDIEDELGLDKQDADSSADADLEGRTSEKASAADEETTDDSQSETKTVDSAAESNSQSGPEWRDFGTNESEDTEQTTECPECGSDSLIKDADRGELICGDCGLVVEEGNIDPGPEWRDFGTNESDDTEQTTE